MVMSRAGVRSRHGGLTAERDLKIGDMARTMTVTQIAERLEISRQTVHNALARNGTPQTGRQGKQKSAPVSVPAAGTRRAASIAKTRPSPVRHAVFVDRSGCSAAARAVIEAPHATCRWVFGRGRDDFAFCGAPATVVAAGALTYCAGCAPLMRSSRERSAAGRTQAATFSYRG